MSCPRLDLAAAARNLQGGGVLLLPTDTLPGLHCRADRPDAVDRILRAKGRSAAKPFLVLAAFPGQVRFVTAPLSVRQEKLCGVCWPGPFSLILPAAADIVGPVTGGLETIAVRVPGHELLCELIRRAGFPLVSTSVNRAAGTAATDLRQAVAEFGPRVDGVWFPDGDAVEDRRRGPGRASALVDITIWPPRVLREGPQPLPPLDPERSDHRLGGGLDAGNGGV